MVVVLPRVISTPLVEIVGFEKIETNGRRGKRGFIGWVCVLTVLFQILFVPLWANVMDLELH